ncbi:MAG: Gfo/Idh/MocA family oxidoreductase [Candidatus Schekmanbacteria bacterium]|nr:Gfo/Idh/MocA family oxidoreductase [Candidatus Schekmanbacteria bacterium]
MENKTRVAVIGVGHLGQHHARVYSALPDTALVGVVDIDRSRAEVIARRYNTQAYTDYNSLLGKVDAVSVVVPTVSHYEVVKDFLNWGIDVLVEKPFTQHLTEAEELRDLAASRKLTLQVGHSERFNPAVKVFRQQITNPLYIEVHRLGPFGSRGLDVDVVLDLMIHDLDIILDIVPSPIRHIHASGVPVLSRQVDIASTRLEFENGCVANITCSRVSAEGMRKMRVFQPAKYISLDYMNQQVSTYNLVPENNQDAAWRNFSLEKAQLDVAPQEPLREELESFAQCVINRTRPLVSAEEGYRALKLALDIKERINQKLELYFLNPGIL